MGATERIASFIVETGYDQIPEEAVKVAKVAILDCLGCALAGSLEPAARIITQYVKEMAGKPEAGVIASGFKTTAAGAAVANGSMAHVLDYDDVAVSWMGHPSAVLLAVVLALGERNRLSGREALAGYILGFEVEDKLGACVGLGHYGWGWHSTATLGTVAAAATAAKMLGLDVDRTIMALGISVSLAGGTRQNFGSMTKSLHAGSAARNGIVAALLAEKGFTADEAIIENPMGFCKLFSGGAEHDATQATRRLGEPFGIVSPGVSIKPYPCCRLTHRCIDAILYLIKEYGVKYYDVEKVECGTSECVPQVLIHSRPKTGLEGKFSMEYCMAIALLDGQVALRQFADDRVMDARAQELLQRVKYVHSGDVGGVEALNTPEVVTVELRDGRKLNRETLVAKGDSRNPMAAEELAAKYRNCASSVLSVEDIEMSLNMVSCLEDVRDVAEVMNLLCSGEKGVS
ncbi:MmgE/PrpD family protein [Chloroflexota bacterium]